MTEKQRKQAKAEVEAAPKAYEDMVKMFQEAAKKKLKESVRVNSICVSCQCLSLYFCYNLTFIC